MVRASLCTVLLAALATPAAAEVRFSAPSGFEIEHRFETALSPQRFYPLLANIGSWWSDAHTYSGKAANLSLSPQPGGCWCEKLPEGGGIEHMRVVQAQPGRKLVLTGSLGPLITEATTGVMTWSVEPKGSGSAFVLNYRVAGFYKGDGARLAKVVDQVLAAQVKSIHKTAEELAIRR